MDIAPQGGRGLVQGDAVTVPPGAAVALGVGHGGGRRRIYPGVLRHAIVQQRHHGSEIGYPVDEVAGAIQWVHQPHPAVIQGLQETGMRCRTFFANDP